MPTERNAVSLLQDLGLTEYGARCFVGLSRVPTASAADIATLSEVPRSRVYDAVDRLHRRGLVDIQQSEPREYRAVSTDAAIETLRERHDSTLEDAAEALSRLNETEDLEEEGVWAIADHGRVRNRTGAFLAEATTEVYVLLAGGELADETVAQLSASADRGATVILEVPTPAHAERIAAEMPMASVRVTDLAADPTAFEGKRLGRMVMVDRDSVLISAVSERTVGDETEETAIWASGPDHGLVVGIRHVLGARIDGDLVD